MRVNVEWKTGATAGAIILVMALASMPVEGATARPAKDIAEQAKAVTAAAHHLQGRGFLDPMLSAESIDNRVLSLGGW